MQWGETCLHSFRPYRSLTVGVASAHEPSEPSEPFFSVDFASAGLVASKHVFQTDGCFSITASPFTAWDVATTAVIVTMYSYPFRSARFVATSRPVQKSEVAV